MQREGGGGAFCFFTPGAGECTCTGAQANVYACDYSFYCLFLAQRDRRRHSTSDAQCEGEALRDVGNAMCKSKEAPLPGKERKQKQKKLVILEVPVRQIPNMGFICRER